MSSENEYLKQSLQKQAESEAVFSKVGSIPMPQAAMRAAPSNYQREAAPFQPKITGFWIWKKVIVPPNIFVVHTRLGKKEPLNCGLGISFSFNPYTDSFLLVPASMQTIMINANCISKEKQGVVVQAYIQWCIEDFSKSYLKLDFSDQANPMRLVNTQLKEQAEASIKDAVATMAIEEILTDKQPIIQSLTQRLRQVANGEGDEGLGIKIVTVQIKEAIVSSPKLWEALQRPFRAEREKIAQMAEIEQQHVVNRKKQEIEREQEELKLKRDVEAYEREQKAKSQKAKSESENAILAQEQKIKSIELEFQMKELKQRLEMQLKKLEYELEEHKRSLNLKYQEQLQTLEKEKTDEMRKAEYQKLLPEILKALPRLESLSELNIHPELVEQISTLLKNHLSKS
jgi:flotillin